MLAMISLVSIGSGVSIVPAWLTAAGFPDVRYLEIGPRAPAVELVLAWSPRHGTPVLDRALAAIGHTLGRNATGAAAVRP
jgi:DNA-binding transcriptional LysR family regulator